LIASLARPGGNVTGLANLRTALPGKWQEVLKDIVPNVARVAVLANPANLDRDDYVREVGVATRSWRAEVKFFPRTQRHAEPCPPRWARNSQGRQRLCTRCSSRPPAGGSFVARSTISARWAHNIASGSAAGRPGAICHLLISPKAQLQGREDWARGIHRAGCAECRGERQMTLESAMLTADTWQTRGRGSFGFAFWVPLSLLWAGIHSEMREVVLRA
jgi:hypothetical protein